MEQMMNEELKKATLLWIGWKKASSPVRDDNLVLKTFGQNGPAYLSQVKRLEDDFYKSDAYKKASTLVEMETIAIQQFRAIHPEIDTEIAQAFAWCYSYDYK